MNVRIYSHFRGQVWDGEVPLPPMPDDEVNETLFRFFNRVDEQDVERLEAMGYDLPSLSVGDFITRDGLTYAVENTGFTALEGEPVTA